MPIIPEAQKAEAGGLQVLGQPQQLKGRKELSETLSQNKKLKVGNVA